MSGRKHKAKTGYDLAQGPLWEASEFFTVPVIPLGHPVPMALVQTLCTTGGAKGGADAMMTFKQLSTEEKISVDRDNDTWCIEEYKNSEATDEKIAEGHRRLLEAYKSTVTKGSAAVANKLIRNGPGTDASSNLTGFLLRLAIQQSATVELWDIEDDGYFYQHVILHLIMSEQVVLLGRLLVSSLWLARILTTVGAEGLERMFTIVMRPDRLALFDREMAASIAYVSESVRMSNFSENGGTEHLFDHLLGRMSGVTGLSPLEELVQSIVDLRRKSGHAWLQPLAPCLRTPSEPMRIDQHDTSIYTIAISHDGSRIVTGTLDAKVIVWEISAIAEQLVTFSHKDRVNAVAITPECDRVISGAEDASLYLWDVDSGERLRKLKGHRSGVQCVALTPDCTTAASGDLDGVVRVWDLEKGSCAHVFSSHTDKVLGVAIDFAHTRVYSSSQDRTISIRELPTGKKLDTISAHGDSVTCIAVTPDNARLVTGGGDRCVSVWDLTVEPPRLIHTFEGHTGMVKGVGISDDGNRVVSCARDRTVRLWSTDEKKQLLDMTHHAKAATSVSITGDGRLVASCGLDKIATVVLISDAVLLSSAPAKTHVGFVSGVDASADGSVTVSSSHDGTARTAHGFTGEPMAACEGHGDLIFGSCVTRDGTHIITGARDRTVRIWDSKSGAQVALLEAHTNSVMAVCCDSTTTRLASGSSDQTAIVWKQVVGTGFNYTSTVCRGHSGNVMSVELSRDGKLLATGSSDATVRLWVAETGEELCSLDDHGRSIEAVVMDVKRETLLSAGADGSVRVWDISLVMKTGKAPCRAVFEGHTDAVTGMALTDDMSYVYTSCDDFTVRAWRVKDASLVAQMVLDEESTSIACCNDRVWVGTQSGRVCRFLLHLPVPVGAKESVAEARASSSGGLVVAKTMGSPSTKKRSKKTGGGDEKDKCLVM